MKHFETQIRDFSQQFSDQIKCMDAKVVADNSILSNIIELYKRRATIEQEYSENLLKLSSVITQRNNADSQKRSKLKNYSPLTVLHSLLASTQYTAKAHKNLSDIYGKQITQRLLDMQDDCVRLNKKSTDILQKHHNEIIRSLNQLLNKQKLYIKSFNDAEEARKRADRAMDQLDREVIRCQDKKKELDKNARIKKFKDEYLEKYNLFKGKQSDSTIARNKYIIHLVSLKESINYFYSTEIKTLVQCAEYGFHNNLTRLSMNHNSCEEALITVHDSINKLFNETIEKIDANSDTVIFLETHKTVLTLKENLHFTPVKGDNINQIIKSQDSVENNLANMFQKFFAEMKSISTKVEEDKQRIDNLSKSLNDLINQSDYDVVDYICHQQQTDSTSIKERTTSLPRNGVTETLYTSLQKNTKDIKFKTENSYFDAMELYLSNEINKINMSTKLKSVENVLKNDSSDDLENCFYRDRYIHSTTAVIIGMKSKLFGGDLIKYSKETKEMVPLVVQSCIRLISLYGMRNIGVFRVPGSQVDVLNNKSLFELGNDPLKILKGTSNDVNLAASILKLYFRELDPPIFNEEMFNEIVKNYNEPVRNEESIVNFMKGVISRLQPPAYATLKYLLTFISHLAEFSVDNCMDVLNLAIIFGPCLMPIPEEKCTQLFQFQTIVNYVAQCLITHHQLIFTKESIGPVYCRDQHNSNDRQSNTEMSGESEPTKSVTKFFDENITGGSDEEMKNLKRNESTRYVRTNIVDKELRIRRNSDSERPFHILSVALFDYIAKSDQELSFEKEDILLLKKKINEHWWNGHVVRGPEQQTNPIINGLIPSALINLYSQNELSPGSEIIDIENSKSSYVDLSSPESQRLSNKDRNSDKRSMESINSENDLDFSPDDNRSLSQSLGNTADLSEFGESKSFGSLENIIGDYDDHLLIKSESNNEAVNDAFSEKSTEEITTDSSSNLVRIRGSRSSITIFPESIENTDNLDEDLQKTMQGLKKIEELNVIKHRNTVHIDKSLLASKFLSPLNLNPKMTLTEVSDQLLALQQNKPNNSDFVIKKPGNVSSLTSSFEMTPTAKPILIKSSLEQTNSLNRVRPTIPEESVPSSNFPPPIFPKPPLPKTFKK